MQNCHRNKNTLKEMTLFSCSFIILNPFITLIYFLNKFTRKILIQFNKDFISYKRLSIFLKELWHCEVNAVYKIMNHASNNLSSLLLIWNRGKFGLVYRCQDRKTGLMLAAKVVTVRKKDEKRDVRREVEIMRQLQHPRVIQLYDCVDDLIHSEMCLILEM